MGEPLASKQTLVLDLPPSCIEFCQISPSYFVVGTYNLQNDEPGQDAVPDGYEEEAPTQQDITKKPQSRNGTLIVFKTCEKELKQIQIVSQPSAILDLHFCPHSGSEDVLAVVSSTGTLAIFKLDTYRDGPTPLQHLSTSTIADLDDGVLFLSVAWHPRKPGVLAVTLSSGEVRLLLLDDAWNIAGSETVITHSLEAWTVAFSAGCCTINEGDSGGNTSDVTIYSGGDDSALRYVSLETADADGSALGLRPLYPPLKINGHEAGVTAILPTTCRFSDGFDLVITGSYDDNLRVFAIQGPARSYGTRKSRLLAERNLGGGVWRLKMVRVQDEDLDPARWSALILVSCMHAGSRVVRVSGSRDAASLKWDVEVLACFEEHKSMNYGSDFVPKTSNTSSGLVCLSTSFYDKLLCLWVVPTTVYDQGSC